VRNCAKITHILTFRQSPWGKGLILVKRKKTRQNKKQAQPAQQVNLRWIWVPIVVVSLFFLAIHRRVPSIPDPVAPNPVAPARVSPEAQGPWDMTNGLTESQIAKLEESVNISLIAGTGDPIPGIKDLMSWLKSELDSGKAAMSVAPLATGETVAFTTMTGVPEVPTIIFAGPVVWRRMTNLSPDDFSNNISESLCHEILHLRLTPEALDKSRMSVSHRQYVSGEAKVWSEQIPKIVRPMMKAGRMIDIVSQKAEPAFSAVGNKNNDAWYKWVEVNLCVKSQ